VKPYLQKIDTATRGRRYDVTPLFADEQAFSQLVADLTRPLEGVGLDAVACIDALGFILGTAIAGRLALPVVPIRKGGKLPVAGEALEFEDYSGERKRLEIRRGLFRQGARVLLVDEWIETGAQVAAAAELIERQGGTIIGIAAIRMDHCDRTAEIAGRYPVHTVWPDESDG
jgi:adenine phosphoribosyltransferase